MHFKMICRFCVLVQFVSAMFLALPAPQAHAATPNVIYISEVAWAGSTLSTSDEWIELGNASDTDISIGGWKIIGAGSSDKILILPEDAIIAAHGVYIISNYSMDDEHCALTIMSDIVTSTVSLSNSVFHIELRDADNNLIDQAGDGGAPFAGYSQALKASLIRVDLSLSGDVSEAWTTADTSQNLYTADFGTPGQIDFNFQTVSTSTPATEVEELSTSTTTTEVAAYPIVVTSTEAEITIDVSTSTEVEPILSQETLTPTSTATTTVEIVKTPVTQTVADTIQITTAPNYQYLRLSEVMPYPASGPEWVEITSIAPDRLISLKDLDLYDSVGKFATLHGEVSSTQPYFVYNISSSRLNNSGDDVYLKSSDGIIIDSFHYADVNQGISWARDVLGAWRETTTPTPNTANVITPKENSATQTNQTTNVTQVAETKVTQKPVESKAPTAKPSAAKVTSTKKTVATAATTLKPTTSSKTSAIKKTTVASTAKPKTTASSTSKTKLPLLIDFDMLQDDTYGNLRVKLQGSVGSVTGLLAGRAFALLNQDGRGIAIKLPTGRKAPALNAYVEVTGSLKFDTHDLPYISMTAKDTWLAMPNVSSTPKTRPVFWGSPSAEDAWSLVSATGTVLEASGSTIKLIADGEEIDVKIKSTVDYRATRLLKDDIITVSGLLDISNEKPAILPRGADEIKLISHAPGKIITPPSTTNQTNGLPGWTPFGAALGAIGAIEGAKKVRSRKKIKTVTTTVVREV